MIGKLQGIVDYIGDDYIILMTGGVGYKVFTQEPLGLKSTVTLWIETILREDSLRLFGFTTLTLQNLFNQLISVSGVGPKIAMSILGTIKTDVLMSAISTGDYKTIAIAPGVGKKMAEKIIVELKNKVTESTSGTLPDLLSALESLGYKRLDVIELAQNLVVKYPDKNVADLISLALRQISKGK